MLNDEVAVNVDQRSCADPGNNEINLPKIGVCTCHSRPPLVGTREGCTCMGKAGRGASVLTSRGHRGSRTPTKIRAIERLNRQGTGIRVVLRVVRITNEYRQNYIYR